MDTTTAEKLNRVIGARDQLRSHAVTMGIAGGDEKIDELATLYTENAVAVKTATGTFSTNSSGRGTINCGFKPDQLVIYVSTTTSSGVRYEHNMVLAINERKYTSGYTLDNATWYSDEYQIEAEQTSLTDTGAIVTIGGYDEYWNYGTQAGSHQYKAIKYTL